MAGHSLKVTLDLGLQKESEKALLQGIENARAGGKPAVAGAFVAIDPRNGQILAIGSYPSFNPNKFAKPLTKAEYAALEGRSTARPAPLTDRAVNGTYPTGSTFKPITAMGALEAGVITPDEGLGARRSASRSRPSSSATPATPTTAPSALVEALKVSSDTYFFEVGELRQQPRQRDPEHGARARRRASRPASTCRASSKAWYPTRAWRARQNRLQLQCERAHAPRARLRRTSPKCGRGAWATTCTWPSVRATC